MAELRRAKTTERDWLDELRIRRAVALARVGVDLDRLARECGISVEELRAELARGADA